MTWTYSALAASTTLDKVRFLVGDTDTTDQLVQDEEINYVTGIAGNVFAMAAIVCQGIAAKFARKADKTIGDLRIRLSEKHKQYLDMAYEYKCRGNILVVPTLGGRLISEKNTYNDTVDRLRPSFERGQHENPLTVAPDPVNPSFPASKAG